MPHRDSTPAGHPCWIDLMTSDPDASRAFYGELFGWTSEVGGPEHGGYITFALDGELVAGAMDKNAMPDGGDAPDAWSVYLAVDDAQATADAVTAHGGQVMVAPMDVPTKGTMAFYLDPGGATVGAWQPGGHTGFGVLAEPGSPGWFELHTRAYDKSVAFYEEVFGWDTYVASDTDEFRYTTLGEGEEADAGMMDDTVMGPDGPPAHWAIYIQVADTDAAVARVEELGGVVVTAPEDTPHGRLAVATDPTGALFRLVG